MKKVTLGGERLGNGKKIKVDLHGWGRSTFDQSRIWRSTMGVGMLIPCFNEIGLPGTTFDIDINTLGHTIPTISPLFGSFKLQVDMFACPIRLYQGILHNNAVNIGLDMSQVLIPQLTIGKGASDTELNKMSTSSLNNYLGIKGRNEEMNTFNAIRHLAYYDIFKNYYSNKQEENAKVITTSKEKAVIAIDKAIIFNQENSITTSAGNLNSNSENDRRIINRIKTEKNSKNLTTKFTSDLPTDNSWEISNETSEEIIWKTTNSMKLYLSSPMGNENQIETPNFYLKSILITAEIGGETAYIRNDNVKEGNNIMYFSLLPDDEATGLEIGELFYDKQENSITLTIKALQGANPAVDLGRTPINISLEGYDDVFMIKDFPLENIDDARRQILSKTNLNQRINLNEDLNFLPYNTNFEEETNTESYKKTYQGLMLKTYQNDIFNCWLSTEYVEKINNLTSITTDSEGNFSIDAFILAKKVYNILNRIAVNGGTYEDWQESVYGENAITRQESPIYIGGTSAEITFEEVVATTSAENQALGKLGGKGIMTNRKGGNIIYKCNEPCIIMAIASITPRVDYYQGNDWFMTNIENMDNLHKPGLDGIGFQDLIENNVVWTGSPNVSLAKQTAWIQYQTAINEVFGQFALDDEEESLKHMVLRRNYETNNLGEITDFTSYIDPKKYNYAFADNTLSAQNFWMQIGFNVKSRRKMAANEIPNL